MKYTCSLNKNHEFKRIYHRGRRAVNPVLAVYCQKRRTEGNRLGITVSAKVGKAVARNRVRRRIREAYRINETRFNDRWDVVIVARVRAAHVSFQEIERSVLSLADKLNILK